MARYNIYDLLKPQSEENLKSLFSKFRVFVDEKKLFEKNQTIESLTHQLLSSFHFEASNNPVFELKQITQLPYNDPEKLEENNKKLTNDQLGLLCIIMAFALRVRESILSDFVYEEKLKEIMRDVDLLIKNELDKKDFQKRMDYEQHIQVMHDNLIFMKLIEEKYTAELEKISELENQKRITELETNLKQIQLEKEKLLQQDTDSLMQEMDNLKLQDGSNAFEGASEEQKRSFARDYLMQSDQLDASDEKLLAYIAKNDKRMQDIQQDIQEELAKTNSQNKKITGFFTPSLSQHTATQNNKNVKNLRTEYAHLAKENQNFYTQYEENKETRENLPFKIAVKHKCEKLVEIYNTGGNEAKEAKDTISQFFSQHWNEKKEAYRENRKQEKTVFTHLDKEIKTGQAINKTGQAISKTEQAISEEKEKDKKTQQQDKNQKDTFDFLPKKRSPKM